MRDDASSSVKGHLQADLSEAEADPGSNGPLLGDGAPGGEKVPQRSRPEALAPRTGGGTGSRDISASGNSGDKGRVWRRRRFLGAAFALALLALLFMNASGVASPEGPLNIRAADLGRTVRGLAPSFGDVRVFRSGASRTIANLVKGPVRVGIQVGHLAAGEQPDELATLRYSTGAHAHGVDEVEVNLAVATDLAERLAARGIEAELLPATVPPGYRAELVLSIHADANDDLTRSGYKSAHFQPARNPREALLKVSIDRAMLRATGLRDDDNNVSGNMLHYYAFNHRRFRHAVAGSTPALLVELGYLSNRSDLSLLKRSDLLAEALELGVLAYLRDIGRLEAAW